MKHKDNLKILVIVPYKELENRVLDVSKNYNDIDIECFEGDLSTGVNIVTSKENHFDIIISRGGTAKEIKKASHIPVIEIEISILDILRIIKMLENFEEKYVFIGYESITKQVKILSEILERNLDIITIEQESEVTDVVQNVKENGYTLIIGDKVTTQLAYQFELNAILIESGNESVTDAINKAISIGRTTNNYNMLLNVQNYISSETESYFIVLNSASKVIHSLTPNENTNHLINESRQLKDKLNKIEQSHYSTYLMIENKLFYAEIINNNKIYTIMFKKQNGKHRTKKLYRQTDINYPKTNVNNDSIVIGKQLEKINTASKAKRSLCINGEAGTGKENIRKHIFKQQNNKLYWDIHLDADFSKSEWKYFTDSFESILFNTDTTFFVTGIESFNFDYLKRLLDIIQVTNIETNQWIFILDSNEQSDSILHYLNNKLDLVNIDTQPLRKRINDLSSIVTLYIYNFKLNYQKNVIGIEPSGLAEMKNYKWPGNFKQLKYSLEHMVLDTTTSFITNKTVKKYIVESEKQLYTNALDSIYDFPFKDRSLEEIKVMAVKNVLNINDGNKTKTARDLNISRSTLWRYLQ